MSEAMITIECKICGDRLVTSKVDWALEFDREHTALHPPGPEESA